MNRKWSQEEVDFIKQNSISLNDEKLLIELQITFNKSYTLGSVKKFRQRLGIKKSGYRSYCQIEQIDYTSDAKIDRSKVNLIKFQKSNICSVTNCNNLILTKNYCKKHYQAWKNTGDPLKTSYIKLKIVVNCKNKQCNKQCSQNSKTGLCKKCYLKEYDRKLTLTEYKPKRKKYKDYTGQIINGFQFIEALNKCKRGAHLWKIKCHCGRIIEATSCNIIKGRQKGCRECTIEKRRTIQHLSVEQLRKRFRDLMKVTTRYQDTIIDLIGCSRKFLRDHLKSQFQLGMSWDNYGINGWHIDHIRPCCSFDLTDPAQQRMCFHYTNLQPLWAKDNMQKGGKWGGVVDNTETQTDINVGEKQCQSTSQTFKTNLIPF